MNILLLEKITKLSLFLAAFLIPLWVLPFTQSVLAYQKQALLVLLVFAGTIAWLATIMKKNEISFRFSLLHIPVAVALLFVGLSTIFSLSRYGSFWGWPLSVPDSFVTFFTFVLLYFLIVNTVKHGQHLFYLLFALVVSGTLAGVYGILNLYSIFFLPFDFVRTNAFNTLGTTNSIAIFAASLLSLTIVLAFVKKKVFRGVLLFVSLVLFTIVASINFFDAWMILIAGLLVLLVFGMWNAKNRSGFGWTSFPLALIIVSVLLMLLNLQLPFAPPVPLEVAPSQSAEVSIVKDTLSQNLLRGAVGSGPGTFVYDYAQFHSPELNRTIFWGTRFSSGASEILDWTATKGILGLLAFLLLIGATLFVGAKYMIRGAKVKIEDKDEQPNTDWMLALGVFASFAAVTLGLFIYTANFAQWLLFWILLASIALLAGNKLRTFSLSSRSLLALGASFGFLVVLIFGLGLLFLGGQKYVAEVQYSQGVSAAQAGDIDKAIEKISAAANMNVSIDFYWRDLAQLYVQKANQVIADQSLSAQDQQTQASLVVRNAVNAAQQSIIVAPNNVANHNVQGFVYKSILGVPGAQGFAISSYEKAAELEPASPFGWTELGRVHILYAQQTGDQEGLDKALESLEKAVELKDDYSPAHYLIAVAYGQQGKTEEAIAKLEQTKIIVPSDVGLAFQLGIIYWQRSEFEKARGEFERARLVNPNHSNSRYMLGLVYDQLGETEKAREEFTQVAAINPDNEEVQQILRNLREGQPALAGIIPSEPPIEETPPEIPGEIPEEISEETPEETPEEE